MLKHSFLREFIRADFEYLVQWDHITADEISQLAVQLKGDPAPMPPRASVDIFDEIEDDPNFEVYLGGRCLDFFLSFTLYTLYLSVDSYTFLCKSLLIILHAFRPCSCMLQQFQSHHPLAVWQCLRAPRLPWTWAPNAEGDQGSSRRP